MDSRPFEMRRRTDEGADLQSDLARFLPDDDRTFLAILAASGLERLEVDGRVWELGVSEEPDGNLEATALWRARTGSGDFSPRNSDLPRMRLPVFSNTEKSSLPRKSASRCMPMRPALAKCWGAAPGQRRHARATDQRTSLRHLAY